MGSKFMGRWGGKAWGRVSGLAVMGLAALASQAEAKVVKTKSHANYAAALAACQSGDVLIFNGSAANEPEAKLTDPPSGLQIIGGSATWTITKTVEDVVFLNHTPIFDQKGGALRRIMGNGGVKGRLTHIDSVCFVNVHLPHFTTPTIEVNGFMRAATFLAGGGFTGASTVNFHPSWMNDKKHPATWTEHHSLFLINATDKVGDGSGSLIANIISHGQGFWTPVHIVNGRGITVAHINSEYCEWGDPYVIIQNGVECNVLNMNPGGRTLDNWRNEGIPLKDGTVGYPDIGNRWGAWRIGGMHNRAIAGTRYVQISSAITGMAWSELVARDPFLEKWAPILGSGVNFAPGLHQFSFGVGDRTAMRRGLDGRGYVFSSAARCTTAYLNKDGVLVPDLLERKSLKAGPFIHKAYFPMFPDFKLDTDGPGDVNLTGKPWSQIVTALNAGQTVYLGPGTYQMDGTLTGGTLYGAGKDKTVLKCKADIRCSDNTVSQVNLYNLTLEGGTYGFVQMKGPNMGFSGASMRFRGQSKAGMTFGNIQNQALSHVEFDGGAAAATMTGLTYCQDGQPCGETAGQGGAMIDKFNVYGCTFKNMVNGVKFRINLNGFNSYVGSRFENMSEAGLFVVGGGGKCIGHYITTSTFENCRQGAINVDGQATADNVVINAPAGSYGIKGDFSAVMNTTITGAEPALTARDWTIVSYVNATGSLVKSEKTWIGMSRFSNLDASKGLYYGSRDLSQYADTTRPVIDQTPPSAPGNLKVTASGAHNVLSWSPSEDAESGVLQYIIERKGAEVGRTNFNYSANHHLLEDYWTRDGYPGIGVYKKPPVVYVDSNSSASATAADYKVVALNSAQIRSDDQMALLRLFPHHVTPFILTDANSDGSFTRSPGVDSVRVGLGDFDIPSYTGRAQGYPYRAVRYFARSHAFDGTAVGIRHGGEKGKVQASLLKAPQAGRLYKVFDHQGRQVLVLKGEEIETPRAQVELNRKGPGLYFIPELGRQMLSM